MADSVPSKGLREFSRLVWTKVMEKKQTTYNEVADELVEEFRAVQTANRLSRGLPPIVPESQDAKATQTEERNVRRRVYDALNVLMAMDIIVKDKKVIMWKGLPSNNADEYAGLLEMYEHRRASLVHKRRIARDLIIQQLAFRRLVDRNRAQEEQNRKMGYHLHDRASPLGTLEAEEEEDEEEEPPPAGRSRSAIKLPLVLLSVTDTATIHLEIDTPARREALLTFTAPFMCHEDNDVLHQLRLDEVSSGSSVHLQRV